MAYLDSLLAPGERILCEARVCRAAYIGAWLMLLGLMMPGGLSGLASTQLALTDRRIIGKTGLFRRKTVDLTHADVERVYVRKGVMGWLIDYGTVIVVAKDGARVSFKGIAWPLEFQQQADEAVEKAVLGKTIRRFVTPEWKDAP